MAGTEARFVINRNPDEAKPETGKMTQARMDADAIKERRRQIHQQAKIDASGKGIEPDPIPSEPPPAREDIETIEFTAPNGMRIEYGPRHDISVTDRIARMFSTRDPTISEYRLTRILMGIRTINGTPPTTIVDEITRTKLANQVGDEVIDLLMYYDRIHWPPLQTSELPVIQKKLRT